MTDEATDPGSLAILERRMGAFADATRQLGLPRPQPVPILAAHHQIAQKIHACTEPGSERAHDLVDLQLLWPHDEDDVERVSVTTERLFMFRRVHAFPGSCTVGPDGRPPTAGAIRLRVPFATSRTTPPRTRSSKPRPRVRLTTPAGRGTQ